MKNRFVGLTLMVAISFFLIAPDARATWSYTATKTGDYDVAPDVDTDGGVDVSNPIAYGDTQDTEGIEGGGIVEWGPDSGVSGNTGNASSFSAFHAVCAVRQTWARGYNWIGGGTPPNVACDIDLICYTGSAIHGEANAYAMSASFNYVSILRSDIDYATHGVFSGYTGVEYGDSGAGYGVSEHATYDPIQHDEYVGTNSQWEQDDPYYWDVIGGTGFVEIEENFTNGNHSGSFSEMVTAYSSSEAWSDPYCGDVTADGWAQLHKYTVSAPYNR